MRIVHELDYKKWSDFVYNHPQGNIFQTPEMYEVYKHTKNYAPVLLAVADKKNNILATLLAVIQKEHKGFLGKFSSRSIIWGGPLVKNDDLEVLDFILREYDKTMKNRAIYTQFRNLCKWDAEARDLFIDNGFEYEDHLNIMIDLQKPKEKIKEEFTSNRRYGIRRAKREGVYCSIDDTLNSLRKCYQILEEVYSYANLPLPMFSFFENLYKYSSRKKGLKIFTAKYNNKVIGCMFALVFKDTIYDFYAGSYHDYYKKYPNDLIPWEIFLWAKKNEYKLFDFGGAGKPDEKYGVRDYKKQYGGEVVNYGRFEKVHKPMLMKAGKVGLKIMKKFSK